MNKTPYQGLPVNTFRRDLAMGMSFVAVGADQGLFRNATKALRDTFMAP